MIGYAIYTDTFYYMGGAKSNSSIEELHPYVSEEFDSAEIFINIQDAIDEIERIGGHDFSIMLIR